jgi:phosphopantothenoylcysteine decarboxylase / phosphopantothenate---cysteine ligase
MLKGRKILLGICGSIAAYKSALLVRLLIKEGAEVRVIMTPSALDFITPLTLSTLSRGPVLTEFASKSGDWNNHVELGLWADVFVIAPLTANTLAGMAHGEANNLLLATYLSARCPVIVAPAMDLDMLQHPSTQRNMDTIRSFGCISLEPGFGELASGLTGSGRMAEPEEIIQEIRIHFATRDILKGKKALVTAGPTYEAIDPVRFIGNNSSGKMGYAIAEALAQRGAHVDLVSGPTSLKITHPLIQTTRVTSADQMYEACAEIFPSSDIGVLSAAVADYKPAIAASEKIKKAGGDLQLTLTRTPDIAQALGKMKKGNQFLVGFALETQDALSNAQQKLVSKNFDLIVLNSLKDEGAGFSHDTNKVTIIGKNEHKEYSLKTKKEVAGDIVDAIIESTHA